MHSRILCCEFDQFPPNITHLESKDLIMQMLLFSNCLRIAILLTYNTLKGNEVGTSCIYGIVKYRATGITIENHLHVLLCIIW